MQLRVLNKGNAEAVEVNEGAYHIYYKSKMVGYATIRTSAFVTRRDEEKHFFRMWRSWGISEDVLDLLQLLAIKNVIIQTPEIDYRMYLADFQNSKLVVQDPQNPDDMQRHVSIDPEFKDLDITYISPEYQEKPKKIDLSDFGTKLY